MKNLRINHGIFMGSPRKLPHLVKAIQQPGQLWNLETQRCVNGAHNIAICWETDDKPWNFGGFWGTLSSDKSIARSRDLVTSRRILKAPGTGLKKAKPSFIG